MPLSLTPVYWLLLQGTWTMARSGARSARRKRLCPTWACSVHPLTLSSKHGSSALEASEKDAYYWGVGEVEVTLQHAKPHPHRSSSTKCTHLPGPKRTIISCHAPHVASYKASNHATLTHTHTHTHVYTHTHTILSLNVYRAHIRTGCC